MVSVRTSVPAMNATPRMTATPVRRKRALLARMDLRVSENMMLRLPGCACGRTRSRTSGRSSSSTMRPSARNTARSAYDAATGSCVTITIV